MTDFAAIDFETANNEPTSVCAVGVVIVRSAKIADTYYHLIHPTPNYYNRWFTEQIHGISREDTDRQPKFPTIWAEIAPKLDGLVLVAHNSRFDEGCLKAVHAHYCMDYPEYTFFCTCIASRRFFGKQLAHHDLETVSRRCGYDLRNHHHALADAGACAWIAMQIL